MLFILWTIMWSAYVLLLCGVSVKQYGGLWEMFTRYQQNLVYIYSIYVIYIHIYIFVFPSAQLFLVFMPKLINRRISYNFMFEF